MAPGSSFKLVAPVTDHDKSEDCPLVIEPGEAVNEEIAGRLGAGEPLFVVNVSSPDTDRLPDPSLDFNLK
jgi:hypothetical protein